MGMRQALMISGTGVIPVENRHGTTDVLMIRPVRFLATGSFVPPFRLDSRDIDARIGRRPGFVQAMTKISSRPVVSSEDQVDMAVHAARAALDEAGEAAEEVDLLLFAAAVSYQSIPATAPLIQHRLGLPPGKVAAFDINSTCLSFLTASDVAASLISTGQYRRALVVSSEVASRALPWETAPLTAALFGDGAAAAVIGRCPDGGTGAFLASRMETYPEAYEACRLGAGGTRYDFHRDPDAFRDNSLFEMDGKSLYRHTFQHFEGFLARLLVEAGWAVGDVDLVLPHQASDTALSHLVDHCGFAGERVVNIIADHGNQIAASLPTVLDSAFRSGRLQTGMKALMVGTSAGLSLGGLAFIA